MLQGIESCSGLPIWTYLFLFWFYHLYILYFKALWSGANVLESLFLIAAFSNLWCLAVFLKTFLVLKIILSNTDTAPSVSFWLVFAWLSCSMLVIWICVFLLQVVYHRQPAVALLEMQYIVCNTWTHSPKLWRTPVYMRVNHHPFETVTGIHDAVSAHLREIPLSALRL